MPWYYDYLALVVCFGPLVLLATFKGVGHE